jgi:tryptophanyl-tRNA synthetase
VCAQFDGAQFSSFKNDLADLAIAKLSPITAEMRRLLDDSAYIDAVLRDGAARADVMAAPILREVHDIVGFLHP